MSTATRLPVTFAIAASGSERPATSALRAAFWYSDRAHSSAIACSANRNCQCWKAPNLDPKALRWRRWRTAWSKAHWPIPTPMAATPIRPIAKLARAAESPLPGAAITCASGTKTSVNSTSDVSCRRLPIFRSGSPTTTPSERMSTRSIAWVSSTTHSTVVMSAAQELVIQRLRPLRRKPPATGVARVSIDAADRSVLAAGSLVANDPTISPRISRGRNSPRMCGGAASSVRPTSRACPS